MGWWLNIKVQSMITGPLSANLGLKTCFELCETEYTKA